MTRAVASFLLFGFILWVLPLGVFIKPSQQKLACDGQRAICMCHIFTSKPADKTMEQGINLKTVSSTNKENSSGGGSNSFVSAGTRIVLNLQLPSLFEKQYLYYKNPNLAPSEYPPNI